jgi:hypothetical protein
LGEGTEEVLVLLLLFDVFDFALGGLVTFERVSSSIAVLS